MRFWLTTLADLVVGEMRDADHQRWSGGHSTGRSAPDENGPAVALFDVGSNDGELTLPLAGRQLALRHRPETDESQPATDGATPAGPTVQVVAFEPQPAVRARLMGRAAERNLSVALWGSADLTVVPLALGDRDELIELEVYTDDTFSSLHSRPTDELERYKLQVVETVSARMRPLDDLVSGGVVPPPHLVKIDVEGAERAVLAGARETLSRYQPPVVVEFSCPNCANAGYDRMEIVEFLRAAGYDRIGGLFRNEDHALYDSDAFTDCRIWNLVAVSSSRSPVVVAGVDRYFSSWRGSS